MTGKKVPDHRKHRGSHPEDSRLFAFENLSKLREATRDLSWLLSRGYASPSALKIVGDRYLLDARQRIAVARCACGEEAKSRRQRHEVSVAALAGHALWIDGYNVLTSIEAALSGGVILKAQDGCYRDMASMHGSYRSVAETIPAINFLGELAATWNVSGCHWLLDQPVSNSGRLKMLLEEISASRNWHWTVELTPTADPILCHASHIVATSDSHILDRATRWFNMARVAIDSYVAGAWTVDLSS
ncbi:MAG TPA: DUF434 domain-containing protein [Lacipirellulaceae bacterium]|nr:DUF434 domain-containing protein [Lacipirellulaceae bacterium]